MSSPEKYTHSRSTLGSFRILIYGLVIVIVIFGPVILAIAQPATMNDMPARVDALAQSTDACVVCHRIYTPGIVDQFGYSNKAAAGVTCRDCHEVSADFPGAVDHNGAYVVPSPTPGICAGCHATEVSQFHASRHATPSYAAMRGTADFTPAQLAQYEAIPEGSYAPDKERNALYELEGGDITRFACHVCHDIGEPRADGSIGKCQKCHLRHEFNLEQARKPETCNQCHIGPDHPQWEIYQESPHGVSYMTRGHAWNWEAEPGTLTSSDIPAATCAICHMSGFGTAETTHDVGDRLTWYLFASVSERRPSWQDNQARMQGICGNCHNDRFIEDFYTDADKVVDAVNKLVKQGQDIVKPLKDANLMTAAAFDEPIDFVSFDLWHHWGRTTKFGSWMQGPDYVQWHGAYEMLRELAELKEITAGKLEAE